MIQAMRFSIKKINSNFFFFYRMNKKLFGGVIILKITPNITLS